MGLKIIHTSDWHLGKKLSKIERIDEQALFLNWLFELILKNEIDLLLISGDIFDSPTPPTEAIKLYFDFLKRIHQESNCKTLIISGNHDSGRFLNAPRSILDDLNVHICGKLTPISDPSFEKNHKVTIKKGHFNLNIILLPYFRTHEIYNFIESETDLGFDEKINNALNLFFQTLVKNKSNNDFNILMAHHLFEGFELSGSEQIISLSGVDSISRELIHSHFDYTALGHIHKTMCLNKSTDNIYYSGAPLNYRFKERGNKNIIFLEIDYEKNTFNIKKDLVNIPEFRKIICKNITKENHQDILNELIQLTENETLHPFIELKIILDGPDHTFTSYVKERLSSLDSRYISLYTNFTSDSTDPAEESIININDYNLLDLFKIYYKEKFPENSQVDENIIESFKELLISVSHLDHDSSEETS